MRRDFTIATSVNGYRVFDGRLSFNLEGLLSTFVQKNRSGILADQFKSIQGARLTTLC